jgi:hypothetical protein
METQKDAIRNIVWELIKKIDFKKESQISDDELKFLSAFIDDVKADLTCLFAFENEEFGSLINKVTLRLIALNEVKVNSILAEREKNNEHI